MPQVAPSARSAQKEFYDARYETGYMRDFVHVYEATRLRQVSAVLRRLARAGVRPESILDYGCGEGRWFDVLGETFPGAQLGGADISARGLDIAHRDHPDARLVLMDDERVPLEDGSQDLVLSVEVLEHVADVARATAEIGRLLRPGGIAVVTTPCANPLSLEWTVNRLRGGLEPTPDGYGRFATDEPGHLRRLRSRDLDVLLSAAGMQTERTYFGAHGFTILMAWLRGVRFSRVRAAIGMLDWWLLRRAPNGATVVTIARRR